MKSIYTFLNVKGSFHCPKKVSLLNTVKYIFKLKYISIMLHQFLITYALF